MRARQRRWRRDSGGGGGIGAGAAQKSHLFRRLAAGFAERALSPDDAALAGGIGHSMPLVVLYWSKGLVTVAAQLLALPRADARCFVAAARACSA
eukprot:COSAG01_NODE_1603_length_9758_cov_7.506471_5_plen_95_part_00